MKGVAMAVALRVERRVSVVRCIVEVGALRVCEL